MRWGIIACTCPLVPIVPDSSRARWLVTQRLVEKRSENEKNINTSTGTHTHTHKPKLIILTPYFYDWYLFYQLICCAAKLQDISNETETFSHTGTNTYDSRKA